jgi:hypothetical protein
VAGGRDTPEDRERRERALVASAAEAAMEAEAPGAEEEVIPAPDEDGGLPLAAMAAIATTPTDKAFVASAARIMVNDRRAMASLRRTRQAWQSEAWDYIAEIGEAGYTVQFAANMISKIRLFPAVKPDPQSDPMPVDADDSGVDDKVQKIAAATLERLRSPQGGQSALLRALDWNLEVAGEAYLHGHDDPETGEEWFIRSVDELVPQGDKWVLRTAMTSSAATKELPADDLTIRLWDPDPRFGDLATSPMRRVLSVCENLLLLTRAMRADAMSHLNNGFLVKATQLSQGPSDPTKSEADGETDDPFEANIRETIVAASVAPGIITGDAKYIGPDMLRHLTFSRPMDQLLSQWIDGLVMRLARGLNMPVEVTTGLQETTFANAAQVKKSEWDAHGEPRAVLICEALTAGYFQDALIEAGVDRETAETIFVWYDPSDAITAPDPTDSVDQGSEKGLLKDETWRRVRGFSEDDAPTDDDVLRRLAFDGARMDPFLAGQLWRRTGIFPEVLIPLPPAGYIDAAGNVVGAPASTEAVTAAVLRHLTAAGVLVAATRPTRAARGKKLGRRLAAIDRELRTRTLTACEAAMRRFLELAGAKVRGRVVGRDRSDAAARAAAAAPLREMCARLGRDVVTAAGVSEADLLEGAFDELAADFAAWVDVAQAQAVAAVDDAVGGLTAGQRAELEATMPDARARGADALKAAMMAVAGKRLYDPNPGAAAVGEQDVTSSVPGWVARQAMAIAGGDQPEGGDGVPMRSAGGGPVGGVATGPGVMGAAGGVERYVWDYGSAPRRPFEPHVTLDGIEFDNFDDDVLANSEGWPDVPFFMPGDHDGCVCDVTPIIVVDEAGDGEEE